MDAGTPKPPIRTAASSPSTDKLSTSRPRKPFTSPGTRRRYEELPVSVTKVEECRVAARRGGIDRERPLIREARHVVRPAGLGPGARQSGAAEWLHTDHRTDHVADRKS